MELTDREYVERSRDGHVEDFSVLVRRYQGPLFAYLAGRLNDPLQAEEAAQESFVRAFRSLHRLRKTESFYAWLLGIAGRVAQEQLRSVQRRRRECEVTDALAAETGGALDEYPLEEAIAALPESHRQVILLRFYEGLSCPELATRLEMPLGTVTKTLSRAYALLRQELEAGDRVNPAVNYTQKP